MVPPDPAAGRRRAGHGHRPERRVLRRTSCRQTRTGQHTAGLLDIRNIIGALLAIYGVILALLGIFADPQEDKTGGVNANLWAGLALLVAGAIFMAWAKLRPVVVPDEVEHEDDPGAHGSPLSRALVGSARQRG